MNGLELLVLGRTLMKIAGDALPRAGLGDLSTTARSVLVDAVGHPDSSVSEITARTGFPQSQVSASVARLVRAGMLRVTADPRDRRRTLVRAHPAAPRQAMDLADTPIDAALGAALGTSDPEEIGRVTAMLETLAHRLGCAAAAGTDHT